MFAKTPSKMSTKKDKIFVIIASYNGLKYWSDLLLFLTQEKYPDFDLEIVVVDNNSTDGSVEYLQEYWPQVRLIKNESNLGFVGANNVGYHLALQEQADYIYLLNQDTVITPGFLQPLYDFAQKNEFGSLQSKLLLWPQTDKINTNGNIIHFLGFGYGADSGQVDQKINKVKKINYASGAGVFLAVKNIAKLPQLEPMSKDLFDSTMFMYLEDLDLGWRFNLLGLDNYLIPQSVIYHKYEFNRSMRQYFWFEKNRLWILWKNYRLATLVLFFPAWLIMELGQLFFALINKRFWQKIKAYYIIFAPTYWRHLVYYKKQLGQSRQRSDRQIINTFASQILFQELKSPLLSLANIIFSIYFQIVKRLIFW